MQLLRVTIEHVRPIRSLTLDLTAEDGHPSRRRVLLGPNGAGKSTVLDCIAHVFLQTPLRRRARGRTLKSSDVRQVGGPDDERPSRGRIEIEAEVLLPEGSDLAGPDGERLIRGTKSFDVGREAAFEQSETSGHQPSDAELAGIILSDVGDSSEDRFWTIARRVMAESTGAACVLLPAGRALRLPERMPIGLLQTEFGPHDRSLDRGSVRYAQLVHSLALGLAAPDRSDRHGRVARLRKVLDDFVPDLPRLVGAEQGFTLLLENQHHIQLSLEELSDGERAVLLLLAEVALRVPSRGVVLIDELEQHIHPRWQRAALDALRVLAPTTQFIITTHSPTVAAYADADVVDIGGWQMRGA
ncbi:MAG TPA: AAA family ATPase [Polyangia bacterium]|jgi:hypothetical protein